MKKYTMLVVLALTCVLWTLVEGHCDEGPAAPLGIKEEAARPAGKPEWAPDIAISDAFMTKYIWRGWNLGNEPVMQTDASLTWYGLTFDFWSNYSLCDDKTKDSGRYQEFTEVDFTVDYTFNIGDMSDMMDLDTPEFLRPLTISGGYIYYNFPNVDSDSKFSHTQEVYLGCGYDMILQPFFTWYWDVDSGKGNSDGGGDGSYFLFGIGHTFDFGDTGITSDVGITASVIDEQWTDKTGWGDMVFSGDVTIPIYGGFYVQPSIMYTLILDRDTYNDAAENEFYGGVAIGFEY